jgi:hypothetical protein
MRSQFKKFLNRNPRRIRWPGVTLHLGQTGAVLCNLFPKRGSFIIAIANTIRGHCIFSPVANIKSLKNLK